MMNMLFCLIQSSFAIPQNLSQQGRLLDSDSIPVEGSHYVTFRIFESQASTNSLWTESLSVNFENGFYTVVLGENISNPLDTEIFGNEPLYLELQFESESPFLPRQLLKSTPYSLYSGVAESLEGGSVKATQIEVGGMTVIDSNGAWVGPTVNLSWGDIQDIPSDFADGVDNDTVLNESEVEDFVTNGALDLAEGTTIGGKVLQEAISCQPGQILEYSGISGWSCADDSVLTSDDVLGYVTQNPIDLADGSSVNTSPILTESSSLQWANINGVPSDLSDGDNDVLNTLNCVEGQVAIKGSSGWECQEFTYLLDKDGDGSMAWEDCDDNDSNLGDQSTDADCDNILSSEDCDDNDNLNTNSNVGDLDCDGVATSEDCDDSDSSVSAYGSSESCAASSCKEIKDLGDDTGDGNYWIKPSSEAYEAYCDMTTDGGGWTRILLEAPRYGNTQTSTTASAGGTFTEMRAEHISGFITCNCSYTGSSQPWQACNPSHGDVWSWEVIINGSFVIQQSNWSTMPSECQIPSSTSGDIYCSLSYSVNKGDSIIPTWYEPSRSTSTSNNCGTQIVNIWGR